MISPSLESEAGLASRIAAVLLRYAAWKKHASAFPFAADFVGPTIVADRWFFAATPLAYVEIVPDCCKFHLSMFD